MNKQNLLLSSLSTVYVTSTISWNFEAPCFTQKGSNLIQICYDRHVLLAAHPSKCDTWTDSYCKVPHWPRYLCLLVSSLSITDVTLNDRWHVESYEFLPIALYNYSIVRLSVKHVVQLEYFSKSISKRFIVNNQTNILFFLRCYSSA